MLPSELIEIIFGYLSDCDIYLSFSRLNNRFEILLGNYYNFSLDFRSISLHWHFQMVKKTVDKLNYFYRTGNYLMLSMFDQFIFMRLINLYLSKLVYLRIDGCEMDGCLLLEELSQFHELQYLCLPNFRPYSWNKHSSIQSVDLIN